MAGDWIKMRGNLWDDPRVSRLVDLTDSSEAAVIGALYWLWATADQHTEDGIMPGLSLRQIDRKTGVKGIGDAMVAIGWLADHPDGVRIINFEDHNGASAKKRAQTAKRVASFKAGNAQNNDADSLDNAEVTPESEEGNAVSVTEALPQRDLEKRREEKREEDTAKTGATVLPVDSCPHQAIIDLYHQICPFGSQIREWTPARQQMLRTRWREKAQRQNLDWWQRFFEYVAGSDFLAGRATTPGRKPFQLGLDWLLKSENFVKVIEGKYENDKVAA